MSLAAALAALASELARYEAAGCARARRASTCLGRLARSDVPFEAFDIGAMCPACAAYWHATRAHDLARGLGGRVTPRRRAARGAVP